VLTVSVTGSRIHQHGSLRIEKDKQAAVLASLLLQYFGNAEQMGQSFVISLRATFQTTVPSQINISLKIRRLNGYEKFFAV
jgi:hypothetical protein